MKEEMLVMSLSEIDRLKVMEDINAKRLSKTAAAKILGLSRRQIIRVYQRYEVNGPSGLISKRRDKPSNNRLPDETKQQAIGFIKQHYMDFGPTFAHEKLTEVHQLALSVESVRKLMIKENIWHGKKSKPAQYHPMRQRRSSLGEMVQIDGSHHDWFEGRGPRCCLLVFIDDATSQLLMLRFVPAETTQGYFDATRDYLMKHGRPLSFYSDRHSIFRVNIKEAASGTGETQFSRAMREVGIELICANSPQAKGRVEKANRTLQDRLVKELRLSNISDINTANAFLPKFIADYNSRFAVDPISPKDAHRKTVPEPAVMDLLFSAQTQRKLSKNLELSYKNILYQVQIKGQGYAMRGTQITVCDQGSEITLLYKGRSLDYKTLDKQHKLTPIVPSKQLENRPWPKAHKPAKDHPWRNSYQVRQAS